MTSENDSTIAMTPMSPMVMAYLDDKFTDDEEGPTVDLTPGDFEQIGSYVREHLEAMGLKIHQTALLARFTPTTFECREGDAYVTVTRRNFGPVTQWLVQSFPVNRTPLMPHVVGVWEDRDQALQAASDEVDAVLEKAEQR